MIIASRYILCLIIALIPINCQQSKKGIHELQSLYYKERNTPLLEKITVLNGIDVLLEKKLHFIQSRKIALVTNHSGIDRNGVPNYKRLMETDSVELKVIFSPEDTLLFGAETNGLPESVHQNLDVSQKLFIPMGHESRSMNLSNAVSVIVFEAWKQNNFLSH